MKNKLIILTILLCMILTLSSVNASDIVNDDDISNAVLQDSNDDLQQKSTAVKHVSDSNENSENLVNNDNIVNKKSTEKDYLEKTNNSQNNNQINEISTTSEPKQKTTNEQETTTNKNILKTGNNNKLADIQNDFEIIFEEEGNSPESSVIYDIYVKQMYLGTLSIYVDNETNPKKTYNLTEDAYDGVFFYRYTEEESYSWWGDSITANYLGIDVDGTHNIKVTFTPNDGNGILLAEQDFVYSYRPFDIEIDDSEDIYTKNSNFISLKSSTFDSGSLIIYVDDVNKLEYGVVDGDLYLNGTEVELDGDDRTYVTLNDLGLDEGTYLIKVTFTPDGGNPVVLAEKNITYTYNPFEVTIYDTNLEDGNSTLIKVRPYITYLDADSGILKVFINNTERKSYNTTNLNFTGINMACSI